MLIVDLRDSSARERSIAGGKGASLAHIHASGVSSPEGFCITTVACIQHLTQLWSHPSYQERIGSLQGQPRLNRTELAQLRACIVEADISIELRQALAPALEQLKARARNAPLRVVVRSSSTIEDSGSASFAGQHDTYLNILGEDNIIERIKTCWASFWSERAYFYRMRKGFDHWQSSMAVVVEELVISEAAGTLFMANPVTRDVKEAVIEANWGLGELVVSGRVSPDTYYVKLGNEAPIIVKKAIKTKRRMLLPHLTEQGGTYEVEVSRDRSSQQVLSDQQILDLTELGLLLSEHYGHPSDIEWALSSGQFSILQARPITSLNKPSS